MGGAGYRGGVIVIDSVGQARIFVDGRFVGAIGVSGACGSPIGRQR
jgi:hypothetical protein